jgi:subtilisin family serine protease
VAIIDSGVHVAHPHVGSVMGGVCVHDDGRTTPDYVDRLGHGTAVAAVIKEKAPDAALFIARVFDGALATSIARLVHAIEWAADSGMQLVNLSLGTSNPAHEPVLRRAVDYALARGTTIVSAFDDDGVAWLPGSLPGVVAVQVDWECPRERCRIVRLGGGRAIVRASGYPRDIPGVPPQRNLSGVSFAVANVTGLLARASSTRAPAASGIFAVGRRSGSDRT